MTKKDRYEYWKESDTAYDTKRKYGQYFHIIDKKECVDLLNQKEEEITFSNYYLRTPQPPHTHY